MVCFVRLRPIVCVAVVVGSMLPAAAIAGETDDAPARPYPTANMLEAGIFSGAFIASQNHELYDSTRSFQAPLDRFGPTFSLRASYFPLSWVGAEVEGGLIPQRNERNEAVKVFTARGHAILQLPWRVTPFGLFGGGWLGASSPSGGDVDRSLHWGGGVKFYPVEWMSVRFDARQIWTAAEGPGVGNTSHFELLGGLSFTLWRADEDAPPPPMMLVEAEPEPEVISDPVVVEVARAMPEPTPAERIAYELNTVHFAWGSAVLRPNAYPALDRAVQLLGEHLELKVRIAGHADATGSEAFNLGLSERRALAVAAYLVEGGIAADRVSTRGFGEFMPAAPNETREGRALNRRCEIKVYDGDGQEVASMGDEEDG